MKNLWNITTSEFRHSGWFTAFAAASLPIYFFTFHFFRSLGFDFTAPLALPQLIVVFSGIPMSLTFKQKRDRLLAQLPLSRQAVLISRYIASGLISFYFYAGFFIGQFLTQPGLPMGTLLMQTLAIGGLAMYTCAVWMLLVELNFHSRQNWWKLAVALLMLVLLFLFIIFATDLLEIERNSFEGLFLSNATWLLLGQYSVSAIIFAISGVLFTRRGTFTGKATSPFMENTI